MSGYLKGNWVTVSLVFLVYIANVTNYDNSVVIKDFGVITFKSHDLLSQIVVFMKLRCRIHFAFTYFVFF